jgi:hypothetical protein
MARHQKPWCRSCGKRKARGLYEDEGFCSIRCAANVMWRAWIGEQEANPDDWCVQCGRWSDPGEYWVGTKGMAIIPPAWSDNCQCPVPIPSFTGEPYTKEEYDDDYDREEA